jgi:hypothetical protein
VVWCNLPRRQADRDGSITEIVGALLMLVGQVFNLPFFLQIQQFENLFYNNIEVFFT